MKISLDGIPTKAQSIELESVDGLRSLVICDVGGMKALRYSRPHLAAKWVWDEEKRFYGNLGEALSDNLPWFRGGS